MRGKSNTDRTFGNFRAQEGEIVVPTPYLTEDTPGQALSEDETQQPPKSSTQSARSMNPRRQRSTSSRWLVKDFNMSQISCEEGNCLTHSHLHSGDSEAEHSASQCLNESPYSSTTADKPRSLSTCTLHSKLRLMSTKAN